MRSGRTARLSRPSPLLAMVAAGVLALVAAPHPAAATPGSGPEGPGMATRVGQPGAAADRPTQLADGLLLVPGGPSGARHVMAFDPVTGDLVDAEFVPPDPGVGTTNHILLHPDGTRLLLSDQSNDVVWAYDLDGNRLGVFAPAGGADTGIMDNIRGMALHPETGHLLVSVASGGNGRAVAEFDLTGNFVGNFIDNNAGGLQAPWGILFREHDVLVSDNGGFGFTGGVHAYRHDGTPDHRFVEPVNFPWQLHQTAAGTVLLGNSSGTPGTGVLEYEADGTFVDIYDQVTRNRGVYELPDGTILTSNSSGVHRIGRDGSADTVVDGVQSRFITFVQTPEPEVELTAAPAARAVCTGEDAAYEVGVRGLGGFDDPVTLAVTGGLPPGTDAGFSVNPVTPAFPAATSTLTVTGTAGLTSGRHRVDVTGSADGPGFPPTSVGTTVGLAVDAQPPATGALREPVDGAGGVPLRPRFEWQPFDGAVDYRFQLATDPDFADLVEDERVSDTNHRLLTTLELDGTYFWRVTGGNGCGDGAPAPAHRFTTVTEQIEVPDGDVAGLIDAINVANAEDAPVTINLAPGGTYLLAEVDNDGGCASGSQVLNGANGLPVITSQVTINGNGATIARSDADGTPRFRILAVDGRAPAAGDLTLHDLTVTNGFLSCPDGPLLFGGGIASYGGAVTVVASTVSDHTVEVTGSHGGGISNRGGTLVVTESTVSGNSANQGGGIHQGSLSGHPPPTAELTGVAVTGNRTLTSARQAGGGIWNSGTMTVTGGTVAGNRAGDGTAPPGRGGGIANVGDLTLTGVTIDGNAAGNSGGAIANEGREQSDNVPTVTMAGVTLSGNVAGVNGGAIASRQPALSEPPVTTLVNSTLSGNTAGNLGGAAVHAAGTLRLTHTTVTGNEASGIDGIFNADDPGAVVLSNSIVTNGAGGDLNQFTDAGHNLVGDGFGLTAPTSVSGDPRLGPLADHGGPTRTHPLLPGSPASHAGDCDGGTVTEDQRGVARPQGARCDIGAFEQQPPTGPGVVVQPGTVDFGPVALGGTGTAEVTVASFGTEDLTVSALGAPAAPFAVTGGTCPPPTFTLPAGQDCTLAVTFTPTGSGDAADRIALTSNAPDSPVEIALTGSGVPDAVIDVDQAGVSATVPQGGTGEETLIVGNLGGDDLTWSVTEGPVDPAVGTVDISHSASDTIQLPRTVACSPDEGTTTHANSYFRTFTLADFDIGEEFAVTGVTFGIEVAAVTVPVTVNLYTVDGEFRRENLTRVGSATQRIPAQLQSAVTVPVTGAVPAGSILAVEIAAPELGGLTRFFPGSNNLGETAPSYLASDRCDIPEPTPYAELGQPQVHLVVSVTGQAGGLSCDLPDWLGVSPAAGTVPGGGTQQVAVTFDATGLDLGDHQANLCLASDDPDEPLSMVPVALAVTEPGESVVCDRTISGVHPGPLTVTEGVTCLAAGAHVFGEINVAPGAGLVATAAVVQGPIAATGAQRVELTFSQVTGPVTISGGTGRVSLLGSQVTGSVLLLDNHPGDGPVVASGNTIIGSLVCTGNQPAPVDLALPNTVTGGAKLGQCAPL